jgi:hypothetical protein
MFPFYCPKRFLIVSFCILSGHGLYNHDYQNLEFQLHKLHKSIRPDLKNSLQGSKQATKIREVIDIKSILKLEDDVHNFVLECRKRNKRGILPTINQVRYCKKYNKSHLYI